MKVLLRPEAKQNLAEASHLFAALPERWITGLVEHFEPNRPQRGNRARARVDRRDR